jgi:lipoyl(octanoyl) transferase
VADSEIAQECVEGYVYTPAPVRILVLRRPPARGGIWVPVSGKVDPGEHRGVSTLRRELWEETGFAQVTRYLPLDWLVVFDGPDGRRWRLEAWGVELDREWAPRLSDEHDAFAWVSAKEAMQRLHYEDNRRAVGRLLERLGVARTAPPNEIDPRRR